MTTKPDANITRIEDASTARWLAATLAAARARNDAEPTVEAVARIRARVFGQTPERRKERTLAA